MKPWQRFWLGVYSQLYRRKYYRAAELWLKGISCPRRWLRVVGFSPAVNHTVIG